MLCLPKVTLIDITNIIFINASIPNKTFHLNVTMCNGVLLFLRGKVLNSAPSIYSTFFLIKNMVFLFSVNIVNSRFFFYFFCLFIVCDFNMYYIS